MSNDTSSSSEGEDVLNITANPYIATRNKNQGLHLSRRERFASQLVSSSFFTTEDELKGGLKRYAREQAYRGREAIDIYKKQRVQKAFSQSRMEHRRRTAKSRAGPVIKELWMESYTILQYSSDDDEDLAENEAYQNLVVTGKQCSIINPYLRSRRTGKLLGQASYDAAIRLEQGKHLIPWKSASSPLGQSRASDSPSRSDSSPKSLPLAQNWMSVYDCRHLLHDAKDLRTPSPDEISELMKEKYTSPSSLTYKNLQRLLFRERYRSLQAQIARDILEQDRKAKHDRWLAKYHAAPSKQGGGDDTSFLAFRSSNDSSREVGETRGLQNPKERAEALRNEVLARFLREKATVNNDNTVEEEDNKGGGRSANDEENLEESKGVDIRITRRTDAKNSDGLYQNSHTGVTSDSKLPVTYYCPPFKFMPVPNKEIPLPTKESTHKYILNVAKRVAAKPGMEKILTISAQRKYREMSQAVNGSSCSDTGVEEYVFLVPEHTLHKYYLHIKRRVWYEMHGEDLGPVVDRDGSAKGSGHSPTIGQEGSKLDLANDSGELDWPDPAPVPQDNSDVSTEKEGSNEEIDQKTVAPLVEDNEEVRIINETTLAPKDSVTEDDESRVNDIVHEEIVGTSTAHNDSPSALVSSNGTAVASGSLLPTSHKGVEGNVSSHPDPATKVETERSTPVTGIRALLSYADSGSDEDEEDARVSVTSPKAQGTTTCVLSSVATSNKGTDAVSPVTSIPTSENHTYSPTSNAGPAPIPPEPIVRVIKNMLERYATRGPSFLALVHENQKTNPAFSFLQPWSTWYPYYEQELQKATKVYLESLKKEESAAPEPMVAIEQTNANEVKTSLMETPTATSSAMNHHETGIAVVPNNGDESNERELEIQAREELGDNGMEVETEKRGESDEFSLEFEAFVSDLQSLELDS